jgi:hypothetical protein
VTRGARGRFVAGDALARFMGQVRPPAENGGCWLWLGVVNNAGYPTFRAGRRVEPAYRWLYEQLEREVPTGLELDHLCRTPRCVNPDHVEPVTHRENIRRGNAVMGINARKTHCAQGHEFTPENTYWRPDGKGRHCLTCRTAYDRTRKH